MDVRAQRTVAAMHQAILVLAETEHVQDLSVAQVAKAAGINRVTFYDHASSPTALLTAALSLDLDMIRAQYLQSALPMYSPEGGIVSAVGGHIVARHAIYCRNMPPNGHGFLADFLTDHFAESARMLLAAHPPQLASVPGQSTLPVSVAERATAQFIAHGAVGAIAAWVHGPAPLIPEQIASLIQNLMPPWWLEATNSQTSINLSTTQDPRLGAQAGQL